jgi:hypothetical protein
MADRYELTVPHSFVSSVIGHSRFIQKEEGSFFLLYKSRKKQMKNVQQNERKKVIDLVEINEMHVANEIVVVDKNEKIIKMMMMMMIQMTKTNNQPKK